MSPGNRHGMAILFTLLPALAAAADEAVRVGRYSTLAPVPTAAQADPLQAMVEVRFPEAVLSVGDAFHDLLRGSGYRLAPAYAADALQATLLAHPLPAAQRMLGPLPLARALTTLAGPAFRLVTDPVHRLVSFEVAKTHRPLFAEPRREALALNAGMLLAQAGDPPEGMPASVSSLEDHPATCPPPGPVQRNLTVPFAERRYLLASGTVCAPHRAPAPVRTTAEVLPAAPPSPRPASPVPSPSPFDGWRRGGSR